MLWRITRGVLKLLVFLWIAILLQACGNMIELERQAHVVVLGIDKGPQEHLIEVTFQIANPQVGTTERSESQIEPPTDILTLTAGDISSAKEIANSVASRKLTFSHLQTLIIGEEMAKSKTLHNIIAASAGDPEVRREIFVIVSKEKASEFIHNNKPRLESRPHKYYSFMQNRWEDTGFVTFSMLNRYFQRLSGELFMAIYATAEKDAKLTANEDDQLAGQVPQKSGDPVQVIGTVIIKEGKMIGKLTGEETRLIHIIRKRPVSDPFIVSIQDPLDQNRRVTVRLAKEEQTKIDIDINKDPPEINVMIPIKIQILSIPSLIDYVLSLDNQKIFKEATKEYFTHKTLQLIEKTQKEFGSEPFLWYLEARKKFMTLHQYDRYGWEEQYKHAKVHVQYKILIEGFGKQFKPARIIPYEKE